MLSVSVIIPTYNQDKLIKNAVESAARQSYKNLEVIVLDDASADNTEIAVSELAKQFSNIRYYKNEMNLGRVKTYHKGLYELAKSDFCILLDGDDYFTDNEFIEKAVAAIEAKGKENVLFFQASHYAIKEKNIKNFVADEPKDFAVTTYIGAQYIKRFHVIGFSHLATLFNRSKAIGNDFYTADIFSSDIDSFLRLCLKFSEGIVLKTNAKIGVWFKHNANTSSSKSLNKLLPSLKIYFKMSKDVNAKKVGISKLWAVRQSAKPILSIILRKLGLL